MLNLNLDVVVETNLDCDVTAGELERLVPFVLDWVGADGAWSVSVVLTDDDRLRALHRQFMGLSSATDVMTFPLETGTDALRGGDIVVSVERAAAQAPEYDQSVGGEVRFLVVHGLLHLLGWDDQSDQERAAMWDQQARLLVAFDSTRPDPTTGNEDSS